MPSFLFQENTPTVNPYKHPSELGMQAGMYRDAKVKESLQNIRSRYDNLLSLQLTNPGNQQFVRDQLKVAVDQLDKYTTADLSLPENVGSIQSLFDPVTDDQGVLNDLAFTQHMNKQRAQIQRLTLDDPTAVAPQNVFPLLQAEQAYRSGSRDAPPEFVNFEPYYNFEKTDNDYLSKLKEDISRSPEVREIRDPLTGQVIALRGEREVKEITKQKIASALSNSFDARKVRQMQLDYNYNRALGVYSPENARNGILEDVRDLQPQLQSIISMLGQTGLTPQETKALTDSKLQLENQIGKLNQVRGMIDSGNEQLRTQGANAYYSFNKYQKDYVDQKADFYSRKEEGALQIDEFDKELFKYQTAINLKTLESQLKMREEQAKTGFSGTTNPETGRRPDGSYEYEPPMKKYLDSIEMTGNAQIEYENPALVALLGNAQREKDGSITYLNTGGGDKDDTKKIYIKEGSTSATPEEAKTVQVNTIIGQSIEKLKKALPNRFQREEFADRQLGSTAARFPGPVREKRKIDLNEAESIQEFNTLVTDYRSGKLNQTDKNLIKPIVDRLDALGIQQFTPQMLAEYKEFANSDKGKASVEIGMLLNSDSKGKYEFIPNGSSNVTKLSNNTLGMSGFLKLTESDLERMGLSGGGKTKRLVESGILSPVAPSIVYENDGDKAVRTTTPTYWLSVVLPVNGDLEQINRTMFEQNEMPNIEMKERYGANRIQQAAFRDYINSTRSTANELTETGRGTFVPTAGSSLDTRVNEFFRGLSNNPNVTPEQSQGVKEEYNRLLKVPSTRYNFVNNVNTLLSNVNRLLGATTAAGASNVSLRDELSARESGGDYTATNPNSSAAGKYQFLWNTWRDKIEQVTGVDSKREFLNNPEAQENFYNWYETNEMIPAVERLKRYNNIGLTEQQLGKLFHFRGEQGAIDYLRGLVPDKPEAYNSSISSYLRPFNKPQ